MVVNMKKCLGSIASVLKMEMDKSCFESDYKITSAIFNCLESSKSDLGARNTTERAEIQQYIEYGLVYLANVNSGQDTIQVLQDLNEILRLKTYLVSDRLTVADLFLYYHLVSIMGSLSIIDKEKYLHVCRWFDNIQLNPDYRLSNKVIDFSTNYLASIVPVRH